ncbi:hypothetical protein JYU34_012101 [Plutella xylostella]|uniref:Suppressor of forked domain-containing protein n=1 Tax=Plutella xylostella TaxID=51655 RepID=A0ABQ7QED5_PLUXY|nr:hypothetical protein JYU34_012101 [Plutella xylostella]
MAIVEDDVRNDSEEENEIEVAVEDEDGEQDSGDDDSDDDDKEEALETKVAELERRIAEDPYNYDDHIELIQALWGLSELECWRSAFEQLQQISLIQAEHWLMRLQTEVSLAHTEEVRDQVTELFQQASLDCYSIPILTCWLGWALEAGAADAVRAALRRVLRLGGAHPAHGKVYWDAYAELEKGQLENLSEDDPSYKEQVDRLLFCYEEIVSRPLVGAADAWPSLEQLVKKHHDDKYLDRIKKQHEAAKEYLQKITPFEDKILESE